MDNKEKDGYEYFLSVNTAVRSSRTLTSNCFFKLKGEEKDTGNRVLNDGCRKVSIDAMFFFNYSYYFSSIVKVVIYAGSKELVSWNHTIRVGTKYADA